ncbi:MAG: DegT/DnrJ/EryC1/StrS family aminotransferase [Lentisphaerae bacterium]|nr:DegT/DnrJ/EryC1/StrS family aminotransferase [Lentisphaerota bacterium]
MRIEKLAIEGGPQAITEAARRTIKKWPIAYPETAEHLKQAYLTGPWSFNGPCEKAFSKEFATYCGAKHGIFMANGTVTIESALHALGVGSGDEVIVPGNTWLATAMAAIYLGAKPVFVDVEPDTLCLDPEQVSAAITPKTKAIIPVHLFGSMADMDRIMKISRQTGIPVIEDCAHAHGGTWRGKGIGTIGQVGSFSFQESKTLPSGEGGICLTNNAKLADKLFRIKHIGYGQDQKQGMAANGPEAGLMCRNYRGVEFTAIILSDALKRLAAQTKLRDANAIAFAEMIKDVPGIKVQSRGRKADIQGYYNFVLLPDPAKLKDGISIHELNAALHAEGLPTNIGGYGPVYTHKLWNIGKNDFRVHSSAVVEETCRTRSLNIFHTWLLANRTTIKAMAKAVRKVMFAYT